MAPLDVILLAGSAVLAGALNAVAGGGSFLTFPSLLFAGIGPVEANATSTVALWPGSVASALAYRRELSADRGLAAWLSGASLLGGLAGALLLVWTPAETFRTLVPLLLLAATLVFTFGDRLRRGATHHPLQDRPSLAALAQLPIAVYGGYFGGGIGFMMLAAFSLAGMSDIHRMNALKSLLAVEINAVAVVTFVIAGKVEWLPAAIMVAASVAGGYGGASIARRVNPALVRRVVVLIGWAMTAWFAFDTWVR